ncbi:MAG: hypothetical protein PHE08_10115 [Bacteroidales bacterium]|nr:hypothetical protein [Bacteroidales bacterium]
MVLSLLEKKITDSYSNAEYLIELLRRIDLEKTINVAISKIEDALKTNDSNTIISISGIVLSSINSKLTSLKSDNDKKSIEYLLADIFQDYLNSIAQLQNGQEILAQINENLKNTCDLHGFDHSAMVKIFNIEKHIVLLPKSKTNKRLYYKWNGQLEELDELARDIYDKKWIYSVKEFKRLFKPIVGSLQIRCNQNKKDELLLLFHVLKEYCLIQPKGKNNSGHFAPFVTYAIDNEEKFLFEKAINKHHEKMKRKLSEYNVLKGRIESIVDQNADKTIRQLRDNGHCPQRKRLITG